MPFIKLYTNLSKDKLPQRFMPELVEELSQIINKDKKWFNWILETDKCMSKVSKFNTLLLMLLEISYLFRYVLVYFKLISTSLFLQGPDAEGVPYIWMEFRSLRTFDSKDDCKVLCPKLFEAVIKLSGLTKEQIHILMGPVEPLQMGHEGAILG